MRNVLYSILAAVIISISGCGEKYSEQGHLLFQEIHKHLINSEICISKKECYKKFEIYHSHGNRVNFSIYNQKNNKKLSELIGFIVENGYKITGGVPISIYVYPKTRADYGNFLISPKPMMTLEINKLEGE